MGLLDELRDTAEHFVASETPTVTELPGIVAALILKLEGTVHRPAQDAPVPTARYTVPAAVAQYDPGLAAKIDSMTDYIDRLEKLVAQQAAAAGAELRATVAPTQPAPASPPAAAATPAPAASVPASPSAAQPAPGEAVLVDSGATSQQPSALAESLTAAGAPPVVPAPTVTTS